MMFDRTEEIEIEAPAEQVFALVSDIRRHPEWTHDKLTVTHIDGPEVGPDAHYESVVTHTSHGSKKPVKGDMIVRESVPPRTFMYECREPSGTYRWTFHLYRRDDGCTVSHTIERLEGSGFASAMQPLAWKMSGAKHVRDGLARLKALAEQPSITLPGQRKTSIELPTEERAGR